VATESGGVKALGDHTAARSPSRVTTAPTGGCSTRTYTQRDDQDREFMFAFPEGGFARQAAMPRALPGFIARFSTLEFLIACPTRARTPTVGSARCWCAPG
jgi:hypothetical protein